MRNLVLFMHVSADGFVAGLQGEMDWIHVDDEIFSYGERLISAADTALYGRVTYEMMQAYWPTAAERPGASRHDIEHSKWYNQVDKIVLSRTKDHSGDNGLEVIRDNLSERINLRKRDAGNNILIFGSPSAAHSLMDLDLIDELWLFVNPILLGTGIPLFKNISRPKTMKLLTSKTFSSGVIAMHYVIER